MLRELSQIIGYIIPLKDSTSTRPDDSGTVEPFTGNTGYPDEVFTGETDLTAIAGLYDEAQTTAANMASNAMPGSEINDQTEPLLTLGTAATLEATHQAISQGEDPGNLLDATASGSAPNTEGGHDFVQVVLLGQHTTPTSGNTTSISTDSFDSAERPISNTGQQPLDFSNTLDITNIQEEDLPNFPTLQEGILLDPGPIPVITYTDVLIGEEPTSNGFFSSGSVTLSASTPTYGFDTPGPSVTLSPPAEPLIIFTDEVL